LKRRLLPYISFPLLVLLVVYCANPVGPTGGPVDQEGPRVIETEPESGTTNFDKRRVVFHFSEFVNRSTLREALTVEPDLGIPFETDWGRKSVKVVFERELPENTTVIVTIGTQLKDMNGNGMAKPEKVAVSTGPEIDAGEINGKILNAVTGRGNSGHRVLLYRNSTGFEEKADYAAETDTSGQFRFTYLSSGTYRAIWVDDRNRNKIWDLETERAQPFGRELLELEKDGADSLGTLFLAQADTTKPELQGVGLFSRNRMRIRFSENIKMPESFSLSIRDSTGTPYSEAFPLYIHPEERYVLYAHSRKPFREGVEYQLKIHNIDDPAGNRRDSTKFSFEGSSQKDTTLQRMIRWENRTGIYPDEGLKIVFAKPITERIILDSVQVVEGSNLVTPWTHKSVSNNILYINPPGSWQQGLDYEIKIWSPNKADFTSIKPTIWTENDLGGIEFRVASYDTVESYPYRLQLYHEQMGLIRDTTFTGRMAEIDRIPPVALRGIVYEDKNQNGQWDPGQIMPYVAPEPYFIQRNIPVKQGFVSEVDVLYER